jgi:ArsR family transcriptional regulator
MDLLFKALQDPTRRGILDMLKKGNLNAGEIADAFCMSKPSISYHLDLLKQARLVSARREGQFMLYSIETTVLDESIAWIVDLVEKRRTHASETLAKGKRAAGRNTGVSLYHRRSALG